MTVRSGLAPIAPPGTRVLVLGSLPGEASLAAQRYYAHPANQFWRLIGGVIGQDVAGLDYDARLAALAGAGIGLWDTIASARRKGSLDTAIREAEPTALAALVAGLPALRAVAFNGGTSARIGRRQLEGPSGPSLIDLPSSSAAYCRISLTQKQERWNDLRKFLC